MLRENDEEAYEEEMAMTSHFSSEGKQETVMAPTIAEAIMPPEFPNKEELETDFVPMIEEDGIKEELIEISNPEEFIAQIDPMLRKNDEEAYEEEAATTYHLSSEGKQETAMTPTIAEGVMSLEFPNKKEMETDFAPTIEEYGIKEELIARSYLEEFIAQIDPMLTENDEETYEEEADYEISLLKCGKA